MSPEELAAIRERHDESVDYPFQVREDRADLLAEVERLTGRLHAEESSHGDTIDQRDEAQEWADKLAYSIAPMEVIGEHSSGNNPWQNALDAPNPLQASLDKVRALHVPEMSGDRDPVLMCRHCQSSQANGIYPCPTIRSIDGSDQ